MNGTPRLRSSFPQTPQTQRRPGTSLSGNGLQRSFQPTSSAQPLEKTQSQSERAPVIPETWMEPHTQRALAFAIYVVLWTWKIWNWSEIYESEEQSLWLFMKWLFLDGAYLFMLPQMRIPWLEWDQNIMLVVFIVHSLINAFLMFQITIPVGLAFTAVGKSVWGAYDLAISEHSVNLHSVLQNDSLILGRQIIHILPEGSAILNPDRTAFCLDHNRPEIKIPLKINSTNPISLELIRTDLDTGINETVHFSKSQIKAFHKEASRMISYSENFHEPKTLFLPVKKSGLYILAKVVDETNLQVSKKHQAQTVIVPCPSASIESADTHKCRGELSHVQLDVVGAAPLRVKYHKVINRVAHESILEGLQPEDFTSPLVGQKQSLVIPSKMNVDWARPQTVHVPLSEHLGSAGSWAYTIDEVEDGFGNIVSYSSKDQEAQDKKHKARLHSVITVHERPNVKLDSSNTIKIASGKPAIMPVQVGSTGRSRIPGAAYEVEYLFTPTDQISAGGDHGPYPSKKTFTLHASDQQPQIRDPGLYSLDSVRTEFCSGEVLEPASVLLENPPKPEVSITSQEIYDKCAGRPIGLRVDLDFVGTPPFDISWGKSKRGDRHVRDNHQRFAGHRGQLVLTPDEAGHYTYTFHEMQDSVYSGISLKDKNLQLQQDVKPSAGAAFINRQSAAVSCIDQDRHLEIGLRGEGPFKIEYELLHAGKRQKFEAADINADRYKFSTPVLSEGGEYTVALKSITDSVGCKEFLNDETKINVRHQKPKVAFGRIDGKPTVNLLEGNKAQLPLRLAGEAPWHVKYRDARGYEHTQLANSANDRITVDAEGVYELVEVSDAICPGLVDEASNVFSVKNIPRPEMRIASSEAMGRKGNMLIQDAVCENDESLIELLFKGAAPFSLQYHETIKPVHGVKSPITKELKNLQNVASFNLDTSQAGLYEYKFQRLSDSNYNHNARHFTPISFQQTVHARPTASFTNPGKSYNFCSVEAEGEEVIPITMQGRPPFEVELELRSSAGKSEIIELNGITSSQTTISIPHKRLRLGKSSVSLRRMTDGNGCSRTFDSTLPRVQISVSDPPSIIALESHSDFCVGEYISFSLSGAAPFTVFYTFGGRENKAAVSSSTFRRLAEKPGDFVITGVQDSASSCRASVEIVKHIHGLPSARVSKGKESYVDIHEGASTEILFEFGGVPPFEFTYARSANVDKGRKLGAVLDMRSESSETHSMSIRASEEGTYEIISIKDRYCAYSKPGIKVEKNEQKRIGL